MVLFLFLFLSHLSDNNTVLFAEDVTFTYIKPDMSFCCSFSEHPQGRDDGFCSFLVESTAIGPFHVAEGDVDELNASTIGHPCPRGQRRFVPNLLQLTVVCMPQEISVEKLLENAVSAASIVQGAFNAVPQCAFDAVPQGFFEMTLQRVFDTVL